jgi:hypothetical protein
MIVVYYFFLTGSTGFSGFFCLSFSAESGIVISRFRPETENVIDPANHVNPVQNKN